MSSRSPSEKGQASEAPPRRALLPAIMLVKTGNSAAPGQLVKRVVSPRSRDSRFPGGISCRAVVLTAEQGPLRVASKHAEQEQEEL